MTEQAMAINMKHHELRISWRNTTDTSTWHGVNIYIRDIILHASSVIKGGIVSDNDSDMTYQWYYCTFISIILGLKLIHWSNLHQNKINRSIQTWNADDSGRGSFSVPKPLKFQNWQQLLQESNQPDRLEVPLSMFGTLQLLCCLNTATRIWSLVWGLMRSRACYVCCRVILKQKVVPYFVSFSVK